MLLFGQLDIPAWLLLCIMGILLIYILGKRNQDAIRKLGLPGPSWSMPLLGESPALIRKGVYQFDLDLLNKYGNTVGFMEGMQASIVTKDIDFIKQVTIKEWYNFLNRRPSGNSEYGLRKMLSEVRDEKWKNIRSHISPTFTSGKLRKMVGLINTSGKNLSDNLEEIARNDETLDPKVVFGHYTMDVIASTAFGLDINSAKDKNNELVKHAKKLFDISFWNPVFLAYFIAPCLVDPLIKKGFSFIPKDSSAYFIDVVNQAINGRKDLGYEGVDFLQLMIISNNSNTEGTTSQISTGEEEEESKDVQYQGTLQTGIKKKPLTDEEIMGNAMIFLFAGYETTASMLQFLAYQLALNPSIQDRLIQEIDNVVGKDQPTYEMAGALKYLEMCIQETLRLYPILTRIDRECKNSTIIDKITIPEGMVINISIIGVHRDPEIYPNPDIFDPERFSSEAKASRDPLAYLPFGAGPRNCIGMRLALLEAKIGMAMVLQKLKFVQCEGTKVPLQIGKEILLAPDKPIQLKLQLRP